MARGRSLLALGVVALALFAGVDAKKKKEKLDTVTHKARFRCARSLASSCLFCPEEIAPVLSVSR
jgi:hypothetical protein